VRAGLALGADAILEADEDVPPEEGDVVRFRERLLALRSGMREVRAGGEHACAESRGSSRLSRGGQPVGANCQGRRRNERPRKEKGQWGRNLGRTRPLSVQAEFSRPRGARSGDGMYTGSNASVRA
jgi:hypothetical protein